MATLLKLSSLLWIFLQTTKSQITCEPGIDCNIDCSDAGTTCGSWKIINATTATSLTLLCNEANSCYGTTIYTPNSIDSTTTIECDGDRACFSTDIYYSGDATSSPSNHSINLICSTSACQIMEINVSNAGIILKTVDIFQNKWNIIIILNKVNSFWIVEMVRIAIIWMF